jgi:tetratricopeptide (TPR) repeat protein
VASGLYFISLRRIKLGPYEIGEELYAKEQYEEAFSFFEQSYNNGEELSSSLNYMGCCQIKLRKYQLAIELFDKALELSLWERPIFNKGRVYLELQNYSEALAHFNRALMINPQSSDAYYYMGVYHDKLEDYEKAFCYYKKSLELDRSNPEARLNFGISFFRLGKFEEALNEFKMSLQNEDTKVDSIYNIGLTFGRLKRYEESIKYLSTFLELTPNDICAMDDIAYMYYKTGDLNSCLKWLEKILTLKPNDEEAKRKIEIVLQIRMSKKS